MRNWKRLLEQFLKLNPAVQLVLALCFLALIIGTTLIIIIVGLNPVVGSTIIAFIAGILALFSGIRRIPTKKNTND